MNYFHPPPAGTPSKGRQKTQIDCPPSPACGRQGGGSLKDGGG